MRSHAKAVRPKATPFDQALACLERLLPRKERERVTGRARNLPCKCGSDVKWKHCCGRAKRGA